MSFLCGRYVFSDCSDKKKQKAFLKVIIRFYNCVGFGVWMKREGWRLKRRRNHLADGSSNIERRWGNEVQLRHSDCVTEWLKMELLPSAGNGILAGCNVVNKAAVFPLKSFASNPAAATPTHFNQNWKPRQSDSALQIDSCFRLFTASDTCRAKRTHTVCFHTFHPAFY